MTSKGNVTAHVLTVNTANPRVTVKPAMANNTLGATAPFTQIVKNSGAPRLIQDGAIVTTLEPGFTEARFTTISAPRTTVGVNGAGELLPVPVPGGTTIQQMRELMLTLGCADDFNVDGGTSCGMYYNGSYLATPGREILITLQVFVD